MRSNCLLFALDRWRREGGYLLLRRSAHWSMPHVLHLSADRRTLTHFVPPARLRTPVQSLFGFEGEVRHDDPGTARPIGIAGVACGAVVLLGLSIYWALTRWRQQP